MQTLSPSELHDVTTMKTTFFIIKTHVSLLNDISSNSQLWRILSSELQRPVVWKQLDVSEEYIASIFRFEEWIKLICAFPLLSLFSFTLEAWSFSETSDFHQPTRLFKPENRTLYNHCHGNLKSDFSQLPYVFPWIITQNLITNKSHFFVFCYLG
jgi:hypothetical protein